MTPEPRALRYMTRFRCIADKCEDSCCAGLQAQLTREDVGRLQAQLGNDESGRAELVANIDQHSDTLPGFVASLGRSPDQVCNFLEPTRLCSLIKRFGDPILPDCCALFPRSVSIIGAQLEVTATLACPEAARLCLLATDSVDRVEISLDAVPRFPAPQARAHPDVYTSHFEVLRAAGVRLLRTAGFPISARIAALAELGYQLGDIFHRGAPDPQAESALRLTQGFERLATLEFLDDCQRAIVETSDAGETVIVFVLGVLFALQQSGNSRFTQLFSAIIGAYQTQVAEVDPQAGQPGARSFSSVLFQVYSRQRDRLEQALGADVEACLVNDVINEWYRVWYTRSPNLLSHAFQMQLRLLCLRFLLVGHPGVKTLVDEVLTQQPPAKLNAAQSDLWGRCVVDVVQVFTKQAERSPDMVALLEERMPPEANGWTARTRALAFAKAY